MSSYSYLQRQLAPSEFLASIQLAPLYNNDLVRHDGLADIVMERWVFPTFGRKTGTKTVGHAIDAVNKSLEHLHPRFLPSELKQIIAGYFHTRAWVLCGKVECGLDPEILPASLIGSKRFQVSTDFQFGRYEALTFRFEWIDRLELPPRSAVRATLPPMLSEQSIMLAVDCQRNLGGRYKAQIASLQNLIARRELRSDLVNISKEIARSTDPQTHKHWRARSFRETNDAEVNQEYLYTYENGRVCITPNRPKSRGAKHRLDIVQYIFFEWLETQDPDDLPLMATAKRDMAKLAKRLHEEGKIRTVVLARTIGDHLKTLNYYKNREWRRNAWRLAAAMRKNKSLDLLNF